MTNTASRFEGLLDRYFETLLSDAPPYAAILGIRAAEGKLGRLSPAFVARRERARQTALRELDLLSPRELANEQQLDRLAMRALLLKECEDFARNRHALEPNAPQQAMDISSTNCCAATTNPPGRRATFAHCSSSCRHFSPRRPR